MSQLDSETRQIGIHKFTVFKLGPLQAQDILIDIGQVLGPALGKAAAALDTMKQDESLLDMDVDDPRISKGIAALVQGITKERMRSLIATMATVTHCDGRPMTPNVMEVVFRGDLPLMYQWLWFSLQTNFGNFFGWATGAIRDAKERATDALSQNTSGDTGQQ